MGNINTKFFEDLENKATWSAGVAFKRSNALPLDKYSVFATLTDAQEYASSNAVAYPGQIIAVAENGKMVAYVLAENTEGNALELQQIGIIPTGDNKTISVSDTGEISLLATKEANVTEGAQLTLTANGKLKWVMPDTTTAEGQDAAIKALQATVNGTESEDGLVARLTAAEGDIDALEEILGAPSKEAVGEDEAVAATGIFKLIEDEITRAKAAEGDLAADDIVIKKDLAYVKEFVDNFLAEADPDSEENIIDKLKEIQAELDKLGEAVDLEQAFAAKADKEYVDEELAKKANIDDVYSKNEVYTKEEIAGLKYVDETTFNAHASYADTTYATKNELNAYIETANAAIDKKADADKVYTKEEIEALGHATTTYVDNKVKAEADIARAAEQKNADAIAEIKVDYVTKAEKEALTKSINDVNTVATGAKSQAETNASNINGLTTRVGNLETGLGETNGTVATQGEKITALEATTKAHGEALNTKADQSTVDTLQGTVNGHSTDIQTLQTNKANTSDVYLKTQTYNKTETDAAIVAVTGTPTTGKTLVDMISDTNAAITAGDDAIKALLTAEEARAKTAEEANANAIAAIYTPEKDGVAASGVLADEIARAVQADEINAKAIKDLADLIGNVTNIMNFRGVVTSTEAGFNEDVKTITDPKDGDVILYGEKEYVYNDGNWTLFGDATGNAAAITALADRVSVIENADLPGAIAGISDRIKAIEDADLPGAIAKALTDANAYTDAAIAALPDGKTIIINSDKKLEVNEVSTDLLVQGKLTLVLNGGSADIAEIEE